jgi:hypothetical protein
MREGLGVDGVECPQSFVLYFTTVQFKVANLAGERKPGSAIAVGDLSLPHAWQNLEVNAFLVSAQVVRLSRLPTNLIGLQHCAGVGRAPLEFSCPAGVLGQPSARPVVLRTLPSRVFLNPLLI